MGFTIDIDTGGTFTDGFFARGSEFRTVKTPTTPHDLTLCFLDCIKEGARAFGLPTESLLAETEVVRFSNTIGTNCIINRDGTQMGLLLTAGSEDLAPTADAEGKPPLVAADMVRGVGGRPGEVIAAAQDLIDRGARCLVIALAGADLDPAGEQAARAAIKREYPREYLGAIPVFLSSDITSRSGYRETIHTAVINAYIHGKLARLLYRADESLRRQQFPGQLLIGHNNGAVARVAKTRAVNTYNSGPAAGLLGAREIGALYGAELVLSADMGGTSFDIGYVRDGEPSCSLRPVIEGFRCNIPMLAIRAVGAGGGSIAAVSGAELRVGPRSAGALPGPACFGLGGIDPTVTDANVVLGFLDPDNFLGGGKRLAADKAHEVIAEKVARPLGIAPEQAAWRIVDSIEATMGEALDGIRAEAGAGEDALMVVYGGGGPLHACRVAERAGIRRIVITPFSAVFSAYSSSLMDIGHLYHRRVSVSLRPAGDFAAIDAALAELERRAARDMRGEGIALAAAHRSLEVLVASGRREAKLSAAVDFHRDHAALEALARAAAAALSHDPADDLTIISVGLHVSAAVPHYRLQPVPPATDLAQAKGKRRVYCGTDGWRDIAVYDRDRLGHGHAFPGPALVESHQTTVFIPEGWRLAIDRFNDIMLERLPS